MPRRQFLGEQVWHLPFDDLQLCGALWWRHGHQCGHLEVGRGQRYPLQALCRCHDHHQQYRHVRGRRGLPQPRRRRHPAHGGGQPVQRAGRHLQWHHQRTGGRHLLSRQLLRHQLGAVGWRVRGQQQRAVCRLTFQLLRRPQDPHVVLLAVEVGLRRLE